MEGSKVQQTVDIDACARREYFHDGDFDQVVQLAMKLPLT